MDGGTGAECRAHHNWDAKGPRTLPPIPCGLAAPRRALSRIDIDPVSTMVSPIQVRESPGCLLVVRSHYMAIARSCRWRGVDSPLHRACPPPYRRWHQVRQRLHAGANGHSTRNAARRYPGLGYSRTCFPGGQYVPHLAVRICSVLSDVDSDSAGLGAPLWIEQRTLLSQRQSARRFQGTDCLSFHSSIPAKRVRNA
jgi:hypothetical protein